MTEHADVLIEGIDVAYIHTPNRQLADWYSETLGIEKGYGDATWQEFQLPHGSRFACDFISYPSSVVQRQPIMLSFRVKDIEAAVETLAQRGVRFYPSKEKTIFQAGPARVATFEDPDGNWCQLSQNPA